ncbi:PPOX class F420-dependent enzyme [Microlunatus endophyticus]|uniref:PPOX class F420-dependent enzyme n=1 Tax=Microlunatus endophyticus TaxID=1716077 RepID=A0A917VZD8_9ACTN|nr:PPOX class F420-dependent oxidoreductase [Microlunatus endophyticus]GGL48626.1 PPOX class F420-dependent enzyme [Microlunatus endophyticus]
MAKGAIPAKLEEVLSRPNPAVMATLRRDGQPVTVATWYGYENGRILLNMDAERKRLSHLRNDPRVSLTVLNGDDWYSHLSLQGRVVEMVDDEGLADIDRISTNYTGKAYDNRERPRISVWVEIDSWVGWGELAQSTVES